MFTDDVKNKDEALCHLFLHCCYKDGEFREMELDFVSGLFVELDLHKELDFKDELLKYKNYRSFIIDEKGYLSYLIKQINPVHTYALYSYCIEVLLSDAMLELSEEKLLQHIAGILEINEDEQEIFKALITQRKAVELEKIF